MSDSPRSVPDWVLSLIRRAREADGRPPFSDQSLVDYRLGARELVQVDEVAAALVANRSAEFVVDPNARRAGNGTAILERLLENAPGELRIWAHGDHPGARALAASHGMTAVRELLHLVKTGTDLVASEPAESFRVGIDEDEWLDLNALIFSRHPEQGSVSRADLAQLESEPWFNASTFLVLRESEAMIGYAWLKVDGDSGEFYVVGVHPDRQGEGIGRRLLDAGLATLHERGITRAHLYVEGDNEAAIHLYRSRGFERDSIDVQYSR